MRFVGLALGVVLVGAGAFLLVSGLRQVLDFPIGACFGPDCFDLSAAFVTLPAAIFSLVIGGILLAASVSAIRRSNPNALGGLSALTALGVVFDVMGAAFLLVEMTTSSIISGTFLFMSITFLLVGGLLVGIDVWLAARRRRASRLRAAGMRGVATIVSVSDSNVTINNDPMVNLHLRVSVPNHPPYDVTKRQVISRIAVGQFLPGAVLPVLVDPADPKDVMIDDAGGGAWATGGTGVVPGTVVRLGSAAAGMPAGATVLDPQGSLSPDLMATISDALRRAADQFAAGDPGSAGAGATTITVNGQTFQVPGGAGQTVVVTPGGEILTGAAAIAAAGAAVGAGAAFGAGAAAGQAPAVAQGPAPVPGSVPPVPGQVPASPAVPSSAPSGSAASASPVGTANGRVSIESLTDTGTQLGDMRLFSFEFSVSPAGGMPYKLSHAALVPAAQVPRLIPGASFPAIIDANLPGGLGIFWDR